MCLVRGGCRICLSHNLELTVASGLSVNMVMTNHRHIRDFKTMPDNIVLVFQQAAFILAATCLQKKQHLKRVHA